MQTRRTISLKAQTYVRLRNFARREDKSVSGVLEEIIATWLEWREPKVDRRAALVELGKLPPTPGNVAHELEGTAELWSTDLPPTRGAP